MINSIHSTFKTLNLKINLINRLTSLSLIPTCEYHCISQCAFTWLTTSIPYYYSLVLNNPLCCTINAVVFNFMPNYVLQFVVFLWIKLAFRLYVEFMIAEWQETAGSALWDDKPIITNLTIPQRNSAAKFVSGKWITAVMSTVTSVSQSVRCYRFKSIFINFAVGATQLETQWIQD